MCIAEEGEYMNLIVSCLCTIFYYVIWDKLQSGIFKSNLFHTRPNLHSIRVYIIVNPYSILYITMNIADIRNNRGFEYAGKVRDFVKEYPIIR